MLIIANHNTRFWLVTITSVTALYAVWNNKKAIKLIFIFTVLW